MLPPLTRRRLLLCALFKHRLRWHDVTPPDMDGRSFSCSCHRCGFIFGGFFVSATAAAVKWYGGEMEAKAKAEEEARVNRW